MDNPRALTPRELAVARLAAEGMGADEIASKLGSAVGTVRVQIQSIYRKLGLSGRRAAFELVKRREELFG